MHYRKKPVTVEAFQMTTERMISNEHWPLWLHEAWQKEQGESGALFIDTEALPDRNYYINTLEGKHFVTPFDYIIKGVKGELYPCKPDIFEMTYEVIEPEDTQNV